MTANPAPTGMPSEDLFELVAGTMADRRRELINEPLARIWPELARAAVTAVDAYRFAFQSPAEARVLAAEAALAAERERCAKIAERIAQAQADGWRENPKQDGCGGSIAASNTGTFIAAAIRAQGE